MSSSTSHSEFVAQGTRAPSTSHVQGWGECQDYGDGAACGPGSSSSCLVLAWPQALTSLEEGAPGNATLPCDSDLGNLRGIVGWGLWFLGLRDS